MYPARLYSRNLPNLRRKTADPVSPHFRPECDTERDSPILAPGLDSARPLVLAERRRMPARQAGATEPGVGPIP
ncbi:hypothetical protein ASF20_02640 [Methylobacterium sp. Leaf88]|nr:hypothetical protein ASF20_02640 [Methylobacterium sp. Leaf88]